MSTEESESDFLPGDTVLTVYGVAVITKITTGSSEELYQCSLWRVPGKSIASAAVAYLSREAITVRLPVAPGMVTYAKATDGTRQKVLVLGYSESQQKYTLSPVEHEESDKPSPPFIFSVQDVEPAPSAKFYPLISELMRRGDQAASMTSAFMADKSVKEIVNKATSAMDASTNEKALETTKDKVNELTTSIQKALPDKEEIQKVFDMLKDEELTVLLQRGKERLSKLVSTEIPQATKVALGKAGITLVDESEVDGSLQSAARQSREKALAALDELLVKSTGDTVEVTKEKVRENFTTMFDSLAQAAETDRALGSIFETISGKTSEWQEATGRLMKTKSASLFFEGASRLQARAATIFSQEHLSFAGELGSRLTKAFTEGDAAVARLKSIELGDALRSRLIAAIETRSESLGGLDGIIAGALSSVTMGGTESDSGANKVQAMLSDLQRSASSATKNAHETLISVLSQRNQYRDVAVLRLEQALCDLEAHMGKDMSPEEIAALARGEGGTFALFEPIAKKATQEIEKQLNAAESSITDPTILGVLERVRQLMSGELTMTGLLDEAVSILNDEKVVSAGETLMKQSENVLDAIESVSGNKMVEDAVHIVEKAGITKEAVMEHVENLNFNKILDTAGTAVTDEKARRELLSSATDAALDFLLRILPSMPVPPFDGVKDGLVYHISNLSMEGFKVRKEDIVVEIAGIRAVKVPRKTPKVPLGAEVGGLSDAGDESDTIEFLPSDEDMEQTSDVDTSSAVAVTPNVSPKPSIKPTELLIIDVQNISALLDNAVWNFEQTYMPYLKGKGMADIKALDGSIRLQFELRRRKVADSDGVRWEPVLCLHDRSCSIGNMDVQLHGEGKLTWILNKLATLFKGPLRDYVVRTIVNVLTSRSGIILEKLNDTLSRYWDLVLKTAGLTMDDLVEAGNEVVTKSVPSEDANHVELVWRERLPLGMNLLLNDESGRLKVVDFPRGSQARKIAAERRIDPDVFKGATLLGVNGTRYLDKEELFHALRDPGRPKTVSFELANPEDAERIRRFVEGSHDEDEDEGGEHDTTDKAVCAMRQVTITNEGEVGIHFSETPDKYSLVVRKLVRTRDGQPLEAEKTGKVFKGDVLVHVNGNSALGENGAGKDKALSCLEKVGKERPLTLGVTDPYMFQVRLEMPSTGVDSFGGPNELVLEERTQLNNSKRVILAGFNNIAGTGEAAGILIGDHLVFVNGMPVGEGCRLFHEVSGPDLDDVMMVLTDPSSYPAALTFARQKQDDGGAFDIENAETLCVTASSFSELGCVFGHGESRNDVVVTDMHEVPGPMQGIMCEKYGIKKGTILAVEAVNGQVVPSYATREMVMNALKRSWASNQRVEVLFCDDERKQWIRSLE